MANESGDMKLLGNFTNAVVICVGTSGISAGAGVISVGARAGAVARP